MSSLARRLGALALCLSPLFAQSSLVEPRIDTIKSRWFYFSSASRPFGLVNLSPDTGIEGDWNAGYLYNEPAIRCFSHVHDWQLAALPVMPATGTRDGSGGYNVWKSAFSHDKEEVHPGYHKVHLEDYNITAELTSTKRVGLHRYSFPANSNASVFLDAGLKIAMLDVSKGELRQTGPRELTGFSTLAPTIRRQKPSNVYFVIQFDHDLASLDTWRNSSGAAARFKFETPTQLLMKVALSYVSIDQARLNLTSELPHWDFDRIVTESRQEWDQILSKINVEGGTERQRTKFYTDLYHALLGRRTYSDVNGKYTDNTGPEPRILQAPLSKTGKPIRDTYTSDAFWGSQFTLNVLWPLAWPRIANDQAASLVDYYHNGGMIARGPSGGNYTFVMIGDQAVPLLSALYHKGIRDFDVQAAYEGSKKNAFVGGIRDHAGYEAGANAKGGGMGYYVERGWIPVTTEGKGNHREAAAQTLEYAYQDWTLSTFARALGRNADAELFEKRSVNWRYLFDSKSGYIRPKNPDGSWYQPFTPVCEGFNCRGFVESNSAIYSYYVMQDLPGLIDAMGGPAKFIAKLNTQFEKAAPYRYITPHGKHGENWIDYENQPSCHMAHLFSHAGAPWLTQYWVRRVKEEVFGEASPKGGYNGDEDQGQMGALSALMAIGLFDVQGGAALEPRYEITSPVFDKVTIQLDPRYYKGKTFTIVARNNSDKNVYIQSAKLNGKPLEGRFWITHKEFAAGGTLELELGPQPNKLWGTPR